MRIPSGKTDQLIYFVAVDSTDLKTRETGLTSFSVYRSRNGGAATAWTTPTVAELSAANMPGVYSLAIDEDTTIASGSDSEEFCVHITQASMAPVTRVIELYRRDTTTGRTLSVDASGRALSDIDTIKTNPVVNAGTVTFPTTATLASTTNITAGTVTTATNVTTVNGLAANVITAAATAADFGTEVANAVWDMDATGHQTQGTFGQAIGDPVADTNTIYKAVVTDATGATVGVDVVAIQADTDNIQTRIPAALVSGRMDSSVGAVASNAITAAGIATDAIDEIVDGVWDEALAGHTTAGTSGKALSDAGAAGDPWSTALPGAYGVGTAGKIVGDNLDATVSSRLASGSYTAPDNASITTILADTNDIQTRLPAALVSGRMDSSMGAAAANTLTASALAADAVAEIQSGLSTLTAADIRSAVGLASANLDTQLDALPTAAEIVAAQLTTAITEAYRANGAAPTLAQFMSEVLAHMGESAVSGTTMTLKKFDHSTTAQTYTLDSATDPTTLTRAT